LDKTENLAKLVKDSAVLFGDFTLRSGKKSTYYIDKYLFETNPQILEAIAAAIAEKLPAATKLLAGVELGAVPLVTATAIKADLPFIIVRKGVKDYGTEKIFEGKAVEGDHLIMIEDIITTGGAALQAARNLKQAGIVVDKIIGVVDREEGGVENIEQEGFVIETLLNKTTLGLNNG